MFRIDLHVHSEHSRDAKGSILELAKAAKAKGLDGFAITDHDTVAGHRHIAAAVKRTGMLIVPGIEVTAIEGHILAIGVRKAIPKGLSAADVVRRVHEEGGVAVAAHPLRLWTGVGPSVLKHLCEHEGLHAAEAHNARERRLVHENTDALCRRLGLNLTGGSDVHMVHEIGDAHTVFPEPLATVEDVVDAIQQGRGRPAGVTTKRRHIHRHRGHLMAERLRALKARLRKE